MIKTLTRRKKKKMDEEIPLIQVILLGDKKLGKTKLVERLKGQEYTDEYYPTGT